LVVDDASAYSNPHPRLTVRQARGRVTARVSQRA
jgi:hypothetical protein